MDLQACCFATQLLNEIEINEGVAAWAQFLGAVIAVYASFRFAATEGERARQELATQREQHEELVRRDDEAQRQRLIAVLTATRVLTGHAWMVIEANANALVGLSGAHLRNMARHAVHEIASVREQLSALPIYDLPTADAVQELAMVRSAASSSERMFEIYTRVRAGDGGSFNSADAEVVMGHYEVFRDAGEEFERCIAKLRDGP